MGIFARFITQRASHLPVLAITTIGLLLTGLLTWETTSWEKERLQNSFNEHSHLRVSTIKKELDLNFAAIESLRAFFESTPAVTRNEFRKFAQHHLSAHKDIQALEWIPRVIHAKRNEFETRARREGLKGFTFTERDSKNTLVRATKRAEYYPVYFVEPLEGNRPAAGYDLASNGRRREALEYALGSNKIHASRRIDLVQSRTKKAGFLVFSPVFANGDVPATVEQRKKMIQGFALGVFKVPDLIKESLSTIKPQGIDFHIIDVTDPNAQEELYFHRSRTETSADQDKNGTRSHYSGSITYEESIEVGGRVWKIKCYPSPTFLLKRRTRYAAGVFLLGIILTGLLAFISLSLAQRWEFAESLVKERTESLRASEERWQFALDGSGDGLWDWNALTNNIFASKRLQEILGFESREVNMDLTQWNKRIHPDDIDRVIKDRILHFENKTSIYESEHRMLCKDGTYKWILDRGKVVARTQEGKPLRVVGTHTDISSRKELEERRRELIDTANHDLKNPLAVIISAAEMTLEESLSKDSRKKIDLINKSGKRMLNIIDDFLSRESLSSGHAAYHMEPLDISKIFGTTADSIRPLATKAGLTLKFSGSSTGRQVMADSTRLTQIFTNLISNAIKHAPKGDEILLEVSSANGNVRASVTDHGRGIPEDFRSRIFGRFAQAREEDATVKGGTGLGLANCKQMIETMGGTIGFKSEPGIKTTFFFDLPPLRPNPS